MKNNYRKLKWSLMVRTVLLAIASVAVGCGALALLVDGLFQDGFSGAVIGLMQKGGLSAEEANAMYGQIFMENKDLFVVGGFLAVFLIFFYFAISRITNYLEEIGSEIGSILNDSEAPVRLEPELRPIAERLNSLKLTLHRREMQVQESEQKKNDLVVFLAHDLKTPLTSVIAYLSMLDEQKDLGAAEREKYTHIALEKSLRLGELINEFFEITRFNLQDIVLQEEAVDLSLMLEQLADESYAVLESKSLTCQVQAEEELCVNGDPDKLARVFDNLLRNAVAYSYPGTCIEIRARLLVGDIIEISFTNQGDPIPQQKLASIFEKFYRADNARSSQTGGAGLGLSIAREIVELHGGTIEASSKGYSNRFTVRLPRVRAEEPPASGKKENVQ